MLNTLKPIINEKKNVSVGAITQDRQTDRPYVSKVLKNLHSLKKRLV